MKFYKPITNEVEIGEDEFAMDLIIEFTVFLGKCLFFVGVVPIFLWSFQKIIIADLPKECLTAIQQSVNSPHANK